VEIWNETELLNASSSTPEHRVLFVCEIQVESTPPDVYSMIHRESSLLVRESPGVFDQFNDLV